ncbi:hypothetical protein MJ575_12280 [Klebsiella pneumoniae]|nr:hypothetical protein MJ575_12280 [Klebsiella pneumoniae]
MGANWLDGQNIISGMIIGLVVAELFTFVIRRNWVIRLPDSVPGSGITLFLGSYPGLLDPLHLRHYRGPWRAMAATSHQIIMDSISTPLAAR